MDDVLLAGVLDRLDALPLDPPAETALLAALEGDERLAAVLGGAGSPRPVRPPAPAAAAASGPGAYLQSVTVAGFRGIGPPATLALTPGPGLTVVCGRNGSGKSSFAEGLEVLLTGGTQRWAGRSAVWRDTWRCLHAPETSVTAELLVEGSDGPVRLRREWAAGERRVEAGVATFQRPGGPRTDLADLGWADAVVLHRPFLSHAELESLLAEPGNLYRQLNSLLGLEDLDAALARLSQARLAADREARLATRDLPDLRAAVAAVDDERAATAAALLAGRSPDPAAVAALATGTTAGGDGAVEVLGALAALRVPDAATVAAAAAELTAAAAEVEATLSSALGDAAATADLLDAALVHRAGHDDTSCPVCGTPGVLDGAWAERTAAEVGRLRAAGSAVAAARRRLEAALRSAGSLVTPPPDVLGAAPAGVAAEAAATAGVWAAWAAWADGPAGSGAAASGPAGAVDLARHLGTAHPPLADALGHLVAAATAERDRLQDRWAPLAGRLGGWAAQAGRSASARADAEVLRRAEAWMKTAASDLRNDRLRPFAERTVGLWRELRQSSNVDVVEVRLAGAATRSHVDFAVTVDGADASGLGVMSQGEVNALALSVFLPRATVAGSPFRFLVIDDPVQAMDPSKVDGLARVLAATAVDRQVVVFTHDDRLPESIRRLELPAHVVQVTRRARSVVELHPAGDPCATLLAHVHAVVRDDHVPAAVAAQVVPSLCRMAVEQACLEATRRRRLRRGEAHGRVEALLEETDTTMPRLALGLLDDPAAGGSVYRWLATNLGAWAADAVRTMQTGTHEGGRPADMAGLLADTRRLVDAIGARR